MLLIATAFALPAPELGAGVGLMAPRSSSGQHAVSPALLGWGRLSDGPRFVVGEAQLSRQRELLVGEPMSTAWMRASIVVGWESGTRPMKVGMGVGPALTIVTGGSNSRQWWWSPGARAALTLRVPMAHDWQMQFSAGLTTRRWSGDVDLGVGWGHRW